MHFRAFCLLLLAAATLCGCHRIEIRDRAHYRWSNAGSGLVLRQGPGLQYARIGTIPYGARVQMLGIASQTTIVGDRVGRWNKVLFQGLFGYSFDAFLSSSPPEGEKQLLAQREKADPPAPPEPRAAGPAPDPTSSPKPVEDQARVPETTESEPASGDLSTPPSSSPEIFAYAHHDPPGLLKMSRDEFASITGDLTGVFAVSKKDFSDLAAPRREGESLEEYLRRSEEAKRLFLKELRLREQAAAGRVYSIYDAPLEMGTYDPAAGRFSRLGTVVPLEASGMITLPGRRSDSHRFVNGVRLDAKVPLQIAEEIRRTRENLLVRLDFSYTESLQDLFDWRRQAYFLPRYLAVYHRDTGRIFYECMLSAQIEQRADPAAPLQISASLLKETSH